jgi:hypothetical protein
LGPGWPQLGMRMLFVGVSRCRGAQVGIFRRTAAEVENAAWAWPTTNPRIGSASDTNRSHDQFALLHGASTASLDLSRWASPARHSSATSPPGRRHRQRGLGGTRRAHMAGPVPGTPSSNIGRCPPEHESLHSCPTSARGHQDPLQRWHMSPPLAECDDLDRNIAPCSKRSLIHTAAETSGRHVQQPAKDHPTAAGHK